MAVTRVLTWNLQGSARPDIDVVAAELVTVAADVVLVQEVQRSQAAALAGRLGWEHVWRFKHWPILVPAEGMSILSPEPVVDVERVVLAASWRFWSWRRRIAMAATVSTPGGALRVVATHLGAGVTTEERVRQARIVAGLASADGIVAGDLNTAPGTDVIAAFEATGLRDAWLDVRPGDPGPTNWPPGPRDGPASQRLDYVLVGQNLQVVAAELPRSGDHGYERYGELSDHLPLVVDVVPVAVARGSAR